MSLASFPETEMNKCTYFSPGYANFLDLLVACQDNYLVDKVKHFIRTAPHQLTLSSKFNGFTALHVCSQMGNVEIVKELISHDRRLCFLVDERGRTPLHIAVIEGRVDVMKELIKACPESLRSVTSLDETVFHLALKNDQLHCFDVLMKDVENNQELIEMAELLEWKDNKGNTVLHISCFMNQTRIIWELLFKNPEKGLVVAVDSKNHNGHTAWELYSQADFVDLDKHICQLFRAAQRKAHRKVAVHKIHQHNEAAAKETLLWPCKSSPPDPNIIMFILGATTLVLAVSILLMGCAFSALLNFHNISLLKQQAKSDTLSVTDMILAPELVPDGFYFIVFSTVTYVSGMVLIVAAIVVRIIKIKHSYGLD